MAEMGTPTIYGDDKLALARIYLEGGWEEQGDVVPQIAGLALAMGVCRDTCYRWAADPEKKDFSDIFTRVQAIQERGLVNKGLSGDFNPAITKMMLTKHGYTDKSELDHKSSDRSLSPSSVDPAVANALADKLLGK